MRWIHPSAERLVAETSCLSVPVQLNVKAHAVFSIQFADTCEVDFILPLYKDKWAVDYCNS